MKSDYVPDRTRQRGRPLAAVPLLPSPASPGPHPHPALVPRTPAQRVLKSPVGHSSPSRWNVPPMPSRPQQRPQRMTAKIKILTREQTEPPQQSPAKLSSVRGYKRGVSRLSRRDHLLELLLINNALVRQCRLNHAL